ncbi:MAG: hypothetical protein ABI602_04020 [Candidatus Saccharibacteria bacterium]
MTLHKIRNFSKIALILAFGGLVIAPVASVRAQPSGPGDTSSPTTTTPTTPKSATTPSLSCGTNLAPDPSGTYCVANTIDPSTCSLLTTAQQIANNCPKSGVVTDTNSTLIDRYLNPFIKLLSVLVGLAVTFGIIYGGIEYTMSAGDPQKAQKGRKHIQDAVLALVSYALIFALLNFLIPGGIAV